MGLVLDHLEAPAPVKLVALILADHADSDGLCWPSYRRIAERACASERSVRRHVAELIASGVVTKLRTGYVTSRDGRRHRVSNAYRIEADALAARPSLLSTDPLWRAAAADHLEVATAVRGRWSPLATKPSGEPSTPTVSPVDGVENAR
jgi:hypothetical protein